MHLYRTSKGNIISYNGNVYLNNSEWTSLINRSGLHDYLSSLISSSQKIDAAQFREIVSQNTLPPLTQQEVWAAGVTYLRSRDARMEESKDTGGSDCYEKVYTADRPELFFKAMPHRVSGPGEEVYIRRDSTWNVPEPELALFINNSGTIQAYTVGNDMSSRSIEGENPLYLPQAKMYERSVALGPCLYIPSKPFDRNSSITLRIERDNNTAYEGSVKVDKMKRTLEELAKWLFAELKFPYGSFLLTGTGLVPPDHFTLQHGDVVHITIENIGTLSNTVKVSPP
ncbi:MAG: fumarylacetoacetate hydrolase family protein [Chitinophagaceae bacterium]|nr:fumarylacetoacetate hydrolase family protein [Chitinophagaceae bacterium]